MGGGGHGLFCTVTVDQDLDFSLIDETRIAPFLSVIVHPSWVSQAPRVLSYCADALVNIKSDKTKVRQCRRDFRKGNYSIGKLGKI